MRVSTGIGVGVCGGMGMAGSGVALLLRSICNSASSLSSVVAGGVFARVWSALLIVAGIALSVAFCGCGGALCGKSAGASGNLVGSSSAKKAMSVFGASLVAMDAAAVVSLWSLVVVAGDSLSLSARTDDGDALLMVVSGVSGLTLSAAGMRVSI